MREADRGVSAARLAAVAAEERARFAAEHPRSHASQAPGFYAGVPMHWMLDWPQPFALVVARATGAELTDVDGHQIADFCLGDTAAMFGHSPAPVAAALRAGAEAGYSTMLPSSLAQSVAGLLRERFGLPYWQLAATASDANRFALRVARAVTRRPRILVMNGCYHGAVDETFVTLEDGRVCAQPGLIGQFADLTAGTAVVEFNDVEALRAALAPRDVACVITEPVLTNCCMVLPDMGYHEAVRRLTRETGTLLLIDETHTISSGPSGYTGAHGLDPDIFVLGKPIAGGLPASVWGFTEAVATGWDALRASKPPGHSGLGTTLSAGPLMLSLIEATLREVMTPGAYAHMLALAERLEAGLSAAIAQRGLPWHAVRVGARVEFVCAPGPLRNGREAKLAHAGAIEQCVHLALLNRGCLISPFHNMMLVSPATSAAQVERLVRAFDQVLGLLMSAS